MHSESYLPAKPSRLPRNTVQTVVAPMAARTEPAPFTPRAEALPPRVWAAPLRSSSVPRVSSQGQMPCALPHAGPMLSRVNLDEVPASASGYTTPVYVTSGHTTPRPVAVPYVHRTTARPQFVRLDDPGSGGTAPRGPPWGPGATCSSLDAAAAIARLQKALADQRDEHEAKLAALQARWEERFTEAIDFWQQAWSTTTAVVKDCNTHCVKLSEVLEASLDQLGQSSVEVAKLQSRVQLLEEAAHLPKAPEAELPLEMAQERSPRSPRKSPSATCSGTSESFKKLSDELAQFANFVSEQSMRMRSDCKQESPKSGDVQRDDLAPEASPRTAAGALPSVDATALDVGSMSELGVAGGR
ncbi:unnamed protein product [Durusdinium trenchii]|uniref:Uncharacterized protein n=2 Tax=Durusdinium trenchii TaxID=1381693 RepID=A0ABP0IK66_9DINO